MQEGLVELLVARRRETNVDKRIPGYSRDYSQRTDRSYWSVHEQVGFSWRARNMTAGLAIEVRRCGNSSTPLEFLEWLQEPLDARDRICVGAESSAALGQKMLEQRSLVSATDSDDLRQDNMDVQAPSRSQHRHWKRITVGQSD
ncbi:hypothetical protein NL676_029609 [Syzygium grande]|nr:hypothetical protein NL676_029609 [Syzygium grande]